MNKKTNRISYGCLAAAFSFFGLLAGCEWPWNSGASSADTSAVIQAFQQSEALEKEVFSKLVFTYEKVFNKSTTQKFLVKDQLGRKWLFKVGRGASEGSVTMYRLFRLLGLDTPEVHKFTFNINGTKAFGTLQRFVDNLGDLERVDYSGLPQNIINDLVRNNIMSWLTASHHVHYKQFLLASTDGTDNPGKIYRIDNTVEWFLMGHDRLEYNYTTPILWHMGNLGYTIFWRRYFQKNLTPDLQKALDWARFISALPDDFYVEFFKDGIQDDLAYFPNTVYELPASEKVRQGTTFGERVYPDIYHPEDRPGFVGKLMERKKNLGRDIETYFQTLASIRKEKIEFTSQSDFAAISAELIQDLKKRDDEYRQDLKDLAALPQGLQQMIEPPLSVDGYKIATNLYQYSIFNPRLLQADHRWDSTLAELRAKQNQTSSNVEKKAIAAIISRIELDRQRFKSAKGGWKAVYGGLFRLQGNVQKDFTQSGDRN